MAFRVKVLDFGIAKLAEVNEGAPVEKRRAVGRRLSQRKGASRIRRRLRFCGARKPDTAARQNGLNNQPDNRIARGTWKPRPYYSAMPPPPVPARAPHARLTLYLPLSQPRPKPRPHSPGQNRLR